MKKLFGFTLAEVLITLGIIGVVAAITIPTLMANIENQKTIAKVKNFTSAMNQSIRLATVKNGDVGLWSQKSGGGTFESATYDSAVAFWSYISPYINVSQVCTKSDIGSKTCGPTNYDVYSYANNTTRAGRYFANYGMRIIMNDGSCFFLRTNGVCGTNNDSCAKIWYDTNGFNTPPNVYGKDVFLFTITPDNIIIPIEENTCSKGRNGSSCAAHILKYNNMKYPY